MMEVKHYLIASEKNNYRPFIVTPAAFASFCLIIWGLRIFIPVGMIFAQSSIDSADLMVKVNEERTKRFIPALITNSLLNTAATAKSNDMISRSYFAHVDPDGKYVWPRIESAGYKPYITLGENLAMDFVDADAVVEAWMNSPTHRQNIVNEKFEDQGMAAVYGQFEPNHNSILITNLFGTLLKRSQVAQSTSEPTTTPPPPAPKDTENQPAKNPPPQVNTPPAQIPVTSESKFLKFLDIIFGLAAAAYALFLLADAIIIHRAKINRENPHSSTHAFIFLLIAVINLLIL